MISLYSINYYSSDYFTSEWIRFIDTDDQHGLNLLTSDVIVASVKTNQKSWSAMFTKTMKIYANIVVERMDYNINESKIQCLTISHYRQLMTKRITCKLCTIMNILSTKLELAEVSYFLSNESVHNKHREFTGWQYWKFGFAASVVKQTVYA